MRSCLRALECRLQRAYTACSAPFKARTAQQRRIRRVRHRSAQSKSSSCAPHREATCAFRQSWGSIRPQPHAGEELTWWDLVARAQLCRLVLFAYYDIPASLDIPLKLHSNPVKVRDDRCVWNDGSNRRKFICFEPKLADGGGGSLAATPSEDETELLRSMGEHDTGKPTADDAAAGVSGSNGAGRSASKRMGAGTRAGAFYDSSGESAVPQSGSPTTRSLNSVVESMRSGLPTDTRAETSLFAPPNVMAPIGMTPADVRSLADPSSPLRIQAVYERRPHHANMAATPAQAVAQALLSTEDNSGTEGCEASQHRAAAEESIADPEFPEAARAVVEDVLQSSIDLSELAAHESVLGGEAYAGADSWDDGAVESYDPTAAHGYGNSRSKSDSSALRTSNGGSGGQSGWAGGNGAHQNSQAGVRSVGGGDRNGANQNEWGGTRESSDESRAYRSDCAESAAVSGAPGSGLRPPVQADPLSGTRKQNGSAAEDAQDSGPARGSGSGDAPGQSRSARRRRNRRMRSAANVANNGSGRGSTARSGSAADADSSSADWTDRPQYDDPLSGTSSMRSGSAEGAGSGSHDAARPRDSRDSRAGQNGMSDSKSGGTLDVDRPDAEGAKSKSTRRRRRRRGSKSGSGSSGNGSGSHSGSGSGRVKRGATEGTAAPHEADAASNSESGPVTVVASAAGESVGGSDDADSQPYPGTVTQRRNEAEAGSELEVDGKSVDEVSLPAGGASSVPQD